MKPLHKIILNFVQVLWQLSESPLSSLTQPERHWVMTQASMTPVEEPPVAPVVIPVQHQPVECERQHDTVEMHDRRLREVRRSLLEAHKKCPQHFATCV